VEVTLHTLLLKTELPGVESFARGKVRDLYALGDRLLIVASDRISAFDVVLPSGIPDKGRILTQLSVFWFEFLRDLVPTHFLTATVDEFPQAARRHRAQLDGRAMLVRRAQVVPIECVVRGYLAGSGWKEYRQTGRICGVRLPAGLRESEQLPEPIFTPATKATSGHDQNISFDQMAQQVGGALAEELRSLSLGIFRKAADYARSRGLLLADTKFEFGHEVGSEGSQRLLLVDEVLTPDSSRFWAADGYQPGRPQPPFDKQLVRDYLEKSGWNKQPPAPSLPSDIIEATRERYREAYRRLTGRELPAPAAGT
jgi:phosphoribosylaminoimidazole-succinocarboxamide synthase